MEMTYETWRVMSMVEKDRYRDLGDLTEQLNGLEGWRVEVVTIYGETRRFIVGRSTGWKPIHLEISTRRSMGGPAAEKLYKSVTKLYYTR